MSQDRTGVISPGARRPFQDQILVRMPFLADRAAARVASLPPGSMMRRRLLMRRGFDALTRKDVEFVLLAYEPDVEVSLFGAAGLGLAERYSGLEGWPRLVRDIYENFGEHRFTVKRVLDGGDRVVAEVDLVGSGKGSGAQVGLTQAVVYYLSPHGKIVRQDLYWQKDGWNLALEAAGLSE